MKRIIQLFFVVFALQATVSTGQSNEYSPAYKKSIGEAFVYYQKGNYKKSLEAFETAFSIYDKDAIDLYNAACLSSLLNDQKKAYHFLVKGIKNGYLDTEWMAGDTDLDGLKNSKYWKKIPKLIAKKFAEIEKDFIIVQKVALTDLIPFQENGKWGYLNKKDKTVAVPANYYKVSFGGNCLKIQPTKGIRLQVRQGGEVSSHHLFRKKHKKNVPPQIDKPKIITDAKFKGFRVSDGKIVAISQRYSIDAENTIPFKIDDKWYIIAANRGKWGVIDEQGVELENFKFNYDKLRQIIEFDGNDTWFYFEYAKGDRGFINIDGKKRFVNAFDNYPFAKPPVMKLVQITKGKKTGIIDLTSLDWLLKPIEETIVRVDYTYEGDCGKISQISREAVKDFYILIKKRDGKEVYIW